MRDPKFVGWALFVSGLIATYLGRPVLSSPNEAFGAIEMIGGLLWVCTMYYVEMSRDKTQRQIAELHKKIESLSRR